MDLLYRLAEIIKECRKEYEEIYRQNKSKYSNTDVQQDNQWKILEICESNGRKEKERNGRQESGKSLDDIYNIISCGDNLEFMSFLANDKHYRGKIKLIYMDPPFFSKADYSVKIKVADTEREKCTDIKYTAYTDVWKDGLESYLKMIALRIFAAKELLTEDGALWIHLDWHAAHYVKILMDEIFGIENFVNEVIWTYKSGGSSDRRFARKHDTLLYYSKSDSYFFRPQKEKSYNRGMKPYRFKGVEEFCDETGWYTLVNMKDVWNIDMVGRTSSERTGYATQKPEGLLERIIESCSCEGDICADFFGGSGTFAAAAQKLNRKWITGDIGNKAVATMRKRMTELGGSFLIYGQAEKVEENSEGFLEVESVEGEREEVCIIRIKSYGPAEAVLNSFKENEKNKIVSIVENNSTNLINQWSIDLDNKDGIFRHCIINFRVGDELKISESVLKSEIKGNIAVQAVDVFGNVAYGKAEVKRLGK